MARIVRTRRAKADLLRIWRFVALDNEAAADKLLERIDQRIVQLATFPESGVQRDEIRPGARLLVVIGYRVLYEYDRETDTAQIVAVVEPYRDVEDLF